MAGEDVTSDLELVAAVNRGDWAAFDKLYFRYRDRVYRLAWRFCGDGEEAQDVVQEVFVYLAGKFREGAGFSLTAGMMTFLYPAVKHTAIGLKKRRNKAQGLPSTALAGVLAGSAEAGAGREELGAVLAGLSEEHREVLLMRYVDDMTLEEIAAALAIPLGTAKSRLHHAVKGMREDPRCRRYFSE
jgi:RNA polymerase sigma-70 factor (ECF subfamily)